VFDIIFHVWNKWLFKLLWILALTRHPWSHTPSFLNQETMLQHKFKVSTLQMSPIFLYEQCGYDIKAGVRRCVVEATKKEHWTRNNIMPTGTGREEGVPASTPNPRRNQFQCYKEKTQSSTTYRQLACWKQKHLEKQSLSCNSDKGVLQVQLREKVRPQLLVTSCTEV